MDAATPPSIVFESAAECADRDRAEELFRQVLGEARAPGPGWVVKMRIGPAALTAVGAEADVADGIGAVRAHNVLAGDVTDCSALTRAMGDWASVVLRTEVERAQAGVGAPPQPSQEAHQAPVVPVPPREAIARAPVARPKASVVELEPEYEMPTLEVGIGGFLMVGGATGGYAGVSPFLIDEVAQGVFLRPAVAVGLSLAPSTSSTWAAGRLDICARLPGRYASRNGIQLDLCGGADAGFSYVASGTGRGAPPSGKTLPYVDIGPSADLRGEVGRLAVSLRGAIGIDVAHAGFVDVAGVAVDAPLFSWRLELDFSSALRR